jgi:nicotinate-nucleotide--dimethylbenzimidazole phosphoribosyltransferase
MNQSSEPCGPAVVDALFGDVALRRDLLHKLNSQTKPPGSLGLLEQVGLRLGLLQRTLLPKVERTRVCVFAGSHGIANEGVSAYPSEVTGQMVLNFLSGGAAVCVLARAAGASLHVVDVGVDANFPESVFERPGFFPRRVKCGTSSFVDMSAMSFEECDAALEAGREQARLAVRDGVDALAIGEMGIGNTTSAAALSAALLEVDPVDVVGRGTGVDDAGLLRKLEAIRAALSLHKTALSGADAARHWLASVGGFEIAAMVGCILEAARLRLAIVVDGFIATASALLALRMEPESLETCFFAHESSEHGHALVLNALKQKPLLKLEMRLGEASGATLVLPLLRAAALLMCEMATFESAKISGSVAS